MLLPQGANKSICRSLGVQRTNVSDVKETRHLVRHGFLENPRQSKICNIIRRKEMLGSGGVGKSLKIGFAQFSKAAYLKVKFKWECDRQAIH